jgi:hypothetical protein
VCQILHVGGETQTRPQRSRRWRRSSSDDRQG